MTRGEITAAPAGVGPKRPKDRKVLLLDAASVAFARLGYHAVAMEDVAESIGVTAAAIYWHVASKQELLDGVVDRALARVEAAADLEGLADVAVAHPDTTLLLLREAGNLDGPARAAIRARLATVVDRVAVRLAVDRPELGREDATMLACAALSVAGRATARHRELALVVVRSLLASTLPALPAGAQPEPLPADEPPPTRPRRVSRREQLLDAAVALFARRGFHAVTIEDIGQAVGMRGPSVYGHFPSKAGILVAAHVRGAEALQLSVAGALASADDPADALDAVLVAYVDLALGHPDLWRTLLTETVYLPAPDGARLRALQRDYVAEWASLLVASQGGDEGAARFVARATLAIVNDHVLGRGWTVGQRDRLLAVTRSALGSTLVQLRERERR